MVNSLSSLLSSFKENCSKFNGMINRELFKITISLSSCRNFNISLNPLYVIKYSRPSSIITESLLSSMKLLITKSSLSRCSGCILSSFFPLSDNQNMVVFCKLYISLNFSGCSLETTIRQLPLCGKVLSQYHGNTLE